MIWCICAVKSSLGRVASEQKALENIYGKEDTGMVEGRILLCVLSFPGFLLPPTFQGLCEAVSPIFSSFSDPPEYEQLSFSVFCLLIIIIKLLCN